MVLLQRIELWTSPLPRECSTSELQQRRARLIRRNRPIAQGQSRRFLTAAIDRGMSNSKTPQATPKPSADREDRLKAALKANLARRKAQAKVRAGAQANKTGKAKG